MYYNPWMTRIQNHYVDVRWSIKIKTRSGRFLSLGGTTKILKKREQNEGFCSCG